MQMHKIISFDGGGIRGVMTATVVERLAAAYPALIGNATLLAGTSTGGLIALGLANGMTPAALRRMYQSSGPDIFDDSGRFSLGGKLFSKYSNDNLRETVSAIFGGLRLGGLAKEVLVPSFDLDAKEDTAARSWKPKFFSNRPGDPDCAELVADVALRTSAAPSFFPIYQGFIDGGVVANNPSIAALAQVLKRTPGQPLVDVTSEVLLLSLGTGTSFRWIDSTDGDWGGIDWIRDGRLLDIMFEGVGDVADFQCKQILEDRYNRLAPVFPPEVVVDLDDDGKIDYLVDFANTVELAPTLAWLAREGW
jgi:hypothetical protein